LLEVLVCSGCVEERETEAEEEERSEKGRRIWGRQGLLGLGAWLGAMS
jgi:hypothetical protein